MRIFLFILIVCSGLEIFGYPIVDVLLLGFFLFLVITINNTLKIRINWILIFCLYMILQVFRGMYVLNDFRMVYWVFFFVVVYFSHLYLIDLYRESKIDLRFVKKIFDYSLLYFIIYGLLAVIVSNPDDFQGIYWVGSSGAFLVIIPFLCSHFCIFQNSRYSLSKLKFPSIILYLSVAVVHQSRIGLYLLFLYLICLMFKTSIFNPKKLVVMLCAIAITLFFWDFTRNIFYTNPGDTGDSEILLVQNIFDDESGIESAQSDLGRVLMVQSIYNKFVSSPVEVLFGSGWYTSRQTLKPFEADLRSQYGLSVKHLQGDKPLQVITLAAIVSDTGVVGLFFILYFFFKSARQIFKTHSQGRMIFLIFLMSNWLFFLVAFTFVSVLSFLLIFPNGILVCLARANSPHNQLIKHGNKND